MSAYFTERDGNVSIRVKTPEGYTRGYGIGVDGKDKYFEEGTFGAKSPIVDKQDVNLDNQTIKLYHKNSGMLKEIPFDEFFKFSRGWPWFKKAQSLRDAGYYTLTEIKLRGDNDKDFIEKDSWFNPKLKYDPTKPVRAGSGLERAIKEGRVKGPSKTPKAPTGFEPVYEGEELEDIADIMKGIETERKAREKTQKTPYGLDLDKKFAMTETKPTEFAKLEAYKDPTEAKAEVTKVTPKAKTTAKTAAPSNPQDLARKIVTDMRKKGYGTALLTKVFSRIALKDKGAKKTATVSPLSQKIRNIK